jgi:predicted nucleic acid-binding protein
MPKPIISDTSCLIVLSNIGELQLLQKIYSSIITTKEVAEEFSEALPFWIEVKSATSKYYQQILEIQIDKGEASAIALALEIPNCILILDDLKARKIATHLGLTITGTIGVLIKAKLQGHLTSIKPSLEKLSKLNFRISDDLIKAALDLAGE